MELTERRKTILGIVVREYITTATPVSSAMIAKEHPLGVSPATIRNDMAALEEAGYLTHPHTSAGRMPTIAGYRYFVEHLMGPSHLRSRERRMIRQQFQAVDWEPETWGHLSATLLAQVAHSASLVTLPKAAQSRFKHMELVELRDDLVLLILVLADGTVKQIHLTLPEAQSQEALSALADQLNQKLAGRDRQAIAQLTFPQTPPIPEVMRHLLKMMEQVNRQQSGELIRAGLEHVLRQPEFSDTARATEVVQVFEKSERLAPLLANIAWQQRGVHVIIAGEEHWESLSDFSLVVADYGASNTRGILGVLGPVRMPYERAVSAVSYISNVMSGLLRKLYGESEDKN